MRIEVTEEAVRAVHRVLQEDVAAAGRYQVFADLLNPHLRNATEMRHLLTVAAGYMKVVTDEELEPWNLVLQAVSGWDGRLVNSTVSVALPSRQILRDYDAVDLAHFSNADLLAELVRREERQQMEEQEAVDEAPDLTD